MSISAVNYNNQASGLYDIFGVNGVSGVDGVTSYRSGGSAEKTSTSSGDTVSISDEARELFSRKTQMLRMGDEQMEQLLNLGAGNSGSAAASSEKTASVDSGLSDEDREAAGVVTGGEGGGESGSSSSAGSVGAAGGGGGGGGGGESGSEEDDRQKELESQLQSLQSQLLSIMSGGGDQEVNQMKAAPIEGKIRSLEAELQAMKTQAAKSAKG